MRKSKKYYAREELEPFHNQTDTEKRNAKNDRRIWSRFRAIWQQLFYSIVYYGLDVQRDDEWWYSHGREVGTQNSPDQQHVNEDVKAQLEEIYQLEDDQNQKKSYLTKH